MNKAFLSWFYDEYSRYVYKLVWEYCTCPQDAEELFQEVWVRLCEKPDQLQKLTKVQQMAYIATTIRNTSASISRKGALTISFDSDSIPLCIDNEVELLNEILDRRTSIEKFREVWVLVPPQARELLERKYFLNESDADIASALGIQANSVRMYLFRARKIALSVLSTYKNDLL